MRNALALLTASWLLVGCGGPKLEPITAGKIGCTPDRITISNDTGWSQPRSWVATCEGKRYVCSSASGGGGGDVSCSPEQ